MSEIKWIKITTDIFDDEKILLIESMPEGDSIIVIWFKLLCLAGKQNNGGVFIMNNRIAYSEQMLVTIFRRKETIVRLALQTFEQFGMIEIIDDVITIPNWEKHQNVEQMEKIREQTRLRVAKCRERKRLEASNAECNATVIESNALDKNRIDKNREEGKESKKEKFVPPSLEDVKEYVSQKSLNVDPEEFYNYFTEGNWIDSKGNKVKNWKQKILTWNGYKKSPKSNFSTQSDNDYDEMTKKSQEEFWERYGE